MISWLVLEFTKIVTDFEHVTDLNILRRDVSTLNVLLIQTVINEAAFAFGQVISFIEECLNVTYRTDLGLIVTIEFLLQNAVQGIRGVFTVCQSSNAIYCHGIDALEGSRMGYPVPTVFHVDRHYFTRSGGLLCVAFTVVEVFVFVRDCRVTEHHT
ncbi:hypothetical protein D3C75_748760 [compost metagenome]